MRLLGALALTGIACGQPHPVDRKAMVREQIEKRGVRDVEVLRAMRDVPREDFVPEAVREHAFKDHPLPIGRGQTISQPYIVAHMTELLGPSKDVDVLEIGTGSGYQAAVLAEVFRDVYTIEVIPDLAASAKSRLARLGYAKVHVRTGDGYSGWPEKAPFARIILTAAPPSIPDALVAQLARGGRMVAPVGESPEDQYLLVIEKDAAGKVARRRVGAVRFVPMVPGPH
ncbi:MAG: protein-L-isoaspartate(D-aspartate) O-methyltransferase [Bryobacteraceae bacterium]